MALVRSLYKFLSSIKLFFWITAFLLIAMVVGTLAPSLDVYHRWWFLAVLGLLAVNTLCCVASRLPNVPGPSLVSHVGILLVLAGGLVSLAYGRHGDMELKEGGASLAGAWGDHGPGEILLPFRVALKKFTVEYHNAGTHHLLLQPEGGAWRRELDVVEGGHYRIDEAAEDLWVGRFLPDFYMASKGRFETRSQEPNNPALQVKLGTEASPWAWAFANYPGMHQDGAPVKVTYEFQEPQVKQFRSVVELSDPQGASLGRYELSVNHPLRYGGYTFYQSGFDPDDHQVSILRVARDPGTHVVFFGCLVLMAGLTATILRRKA